MEGSSGALSFWLGFSVNSTSSLPPVGPWDAPKHLVERRWIDCLESGSLNLALTSTTSNGQRQNEALQVCSSVWDPSAATTSLCDLEKQFLLSWELFPPGGGRKDGAERVGSFTPFKKGTRLRGQVLGGC